MNNDEMSKIITYKNGASIFISGLQPYYSTGNEFTKNKIKTVLSVLNDQTPPNLNTYGIDHYFFNIKDHPKEKIYTIFYKTSNIVLRSILNGENVLVHCRAGISRSVTIVVAFLLSCLLCYPYLIIPYVPKSPENNWTLSIIEFIRKKRPIANPNEGFIDQLLQYENYLYSITDKISC